MPIIDLEAILRSIKQYRERIRALGVSEDREFAYYADLSGSEDSRDEAQNRQAFERTVSGLDLSAGELVFIKAVLESGDGR